MKKPSICKGCIYNTPKTRGGWGVVCNGLTQRLHNRCPEWRITELAKEGKPRNLIEHASGAVVSQLTDEIRNTRAITKEMIKLL